eukprot:9006380-Pyramimonas_sp.AAC.1
MCNSLASSAWEIVRMPWDKIGNVLIGHAAGLTIARDVNKCADNPVPPHVPAHGFTSANFSDVPRE